MPTLWGYDIYLMQQNEWSFKTIQTLSQSIETLIEKTDECKQHILELTQVFYDEWAKIVFD